MLAPLGALTYLLVSSWQPIDTERQQGAKLSILDLAGSFGPSSSILAPRVDLRSQPRRFEFPLGLVVDRGPLRLQIESAWVDRGKTFAAHLSQLDGELELAKLHLGQVEIGQKPPHARGIYLAGSLSKRAVSHLQARSVAMTPSLVQRLLRRRDRRLTMPATAKPDAAQPSVEMRAPFLRAKAGLLNRMTLHQVEITFASGYQLSAKKISGYLSQSRWRCERVAIVSPHGDRRDLAYAEVDWESLEISKATRLNLPLIRVRTPEVISLLALERGESLSSATRQLPKATP